MPNKLLKYRLAESSSDSMVRMTSLTQQHITKYVCFDYWTFCEYIYTSIRIVNADRD